MLSSSTQPWGDSRSNLFELVKEFDNEDEKRKLTAQIRDLRKSISLLKARELKLKSGSQSSPDSSRAQDETVDPALLESVSNLQAYDLFNLCHGYSLTSDGTRIRIEFRPNLQGQIFGPYQVILEKESDKFRIVSSHLPGAKSFEPETRDHNSDRVKQRKRFFKKLKPQSSSVIDLDCFQSEHLSDNREEVNQLAKVVFKHLKAYLSRLKQVMFFQKKFSSQITNLIFNDDVTTVSFTLKVDDCNETRDEKASTIDLNFVVRYKADLDLPLPGALSVKIEGANFSEDDQEDLWTQVQVFLSLPLAEATAEAFGDFE